MVKLGRGDDEKRRVWWSVQVSKVNVTFRDIIYHYRKQPQCKPYVFRNVLLDGSVVWRSGVGVRGPCMVKVLGDRRRWLYRVTGLSGVSCYGSGCACVTLISCGMVVQKAGQETGDIIRFYNEVFVPSTKSFLLQVGSSAGVAVPSSVGVPYERNQGEGDPLSW